MGTITVGKYGKGQCGTIGEAFELAMSMKGHVDINILNGIYEEKLEFDRSNVTIIGEDPLNTVITYNDSARCLLADGSRMGTLRSATLRLNGNNIIVKNITVANQVGNGRDYGQAVAMYAGGDCQNYINCRFIGCQDTLFTAPGPEKFDEFGRRMDNRTTSLRMRQYYKNCYIRGDVDFIFGGATAFFDNCEIFSQYNITEYDDKYNGEIKGYVTAACTWQDTEYGYVFAHCKFTGDCPKNSVYLGRPWRQHAKTVIIECELGEHIRREGWHDWDKPEARTDTFYAEYRNKYASDAKRESWIHFLSDEEVREFRRKKVLLEDFYED